MQDLISILDSQGLVYSERPGKSAAVPKHMVIEDPRASFIPGPFSKVAGMSVMTRDTQELQ